MQQGRALQLTSKRLQRTDSNVEDSIVRNNIQEEQ